MIDKSIGKLIKAARVFYGMSQGALAKKIGIDQANVSRLEGSFYFYNYGMTGNARKAIKILQLEDPSSPFIRAVFDGLTGEREKS